MTISRGQMNRQLREGGGIMDAFQEKVLVVVTTEVLIWVKKFWLKKYLEV